MNQRQGFGVLLIVAGIITFLIGMVTDAGPDAYVEYNKTRKGISPRVQKIRLIGAGIMGIILGILIILEVF